MVPALPSGPSTAPWNVRLDNLELGILLLTQPWLAGEGLRRADLERQIGRLASRLPLGPVYFQRVKRSVARLEEVGALRALGEGRTQRYLLTPEGFASLVLNLRCLDTDPTLDASEFELKRSLVALWNLVLDRLGDETEGEEPIPEPPGVAAFFDAVEALEIDGRPAVTEESLREALDVLRLLELQRTRVLQLLAEARTSDSRAGSPPGALAELLPEETVDLLAAAPKAAALVRTLSTETLPALTRGAAVLRYESYLGYLDGLSRLHGGSLKRVSLDSIRGLRSGSRG